MSVTKLKTVGSWTTAHRQGAVVDLRTNVRGRVITGMLTGGDPAPDGPAVTVDPREGCAHEEASPSGATPSSLSSVPPLLR
jgi:hypothetical protein